MEEIILSKADFEEVTCPNCGSDQYEEYDAIEWKGLVLHYRLCKNCSLKYMSPRPTQEWYHNYYKVGFWQDLLKRNAFQDKGFKFRIVEKDQVLKQKISNNRRRAKRINLILKPIISTKNKLRVLEIGAGFGQTLFLFRKKYDAKIYAIEPNEEAREHLNSISIPLVGMYAEDLVRLPPEDKFDIIITSHVLENLSYPMVVLKTISNYLKDDGIYFIDTTNMFYRNDTNPYHMLLFTPESIENMLNRAGFNIIKSHFEDYPDRIKNPEKIKALDPYISAVCRKGEIKEKSLSVDVESIINVQKLGEQYFKKSQKSGLAIHNRFDKRVVNKLRRVFNIPIPVVLGKEQKKLTI